MEFVKVESSNVKEVAWENNELYVIYNGDNCYKYENVPKEVYDKLLLSESKGKFMNSEVKNKYNYKKLIVLTEQINK